MNMVRFNGEISVVLKKVVLPLITHEVTFFSIMLVIDAPSTYNAIMGRPWLHTMKVIPSTLHQKSDFQASMESKS